MPLPPVLIELTARKEAFHRYTTFQVMTLFPTLLVDSMVTPLPAAQFAHVLLAGMHDSSVDVQIEAFKAVEAVLSRGMTAYERKEVGPGLIIEAFKVSRVPPSLHNSRSAASDLMQVLQALPRDLLHLALQPFVDLAWDHTSLLRPAADQLLRFFPIILSPPKYKEHAWSTWSKPMDEMPDGEDWLEYANPAQEILLAFSHAYPSIVRDWDAGRLVVDLVPILVGRLVAELVWEGEDQTDWLKEDDVSTLFLVVGGDQRADEIG